jgi:hypothetical protein
MLKVAGQPADIFAATAWCKGWYKAGLGSTDRERVLGGSICLDEFADIEVSVPRAFCEHIVRYGVPLEQKFYSVFPAKRTWPLLVQVAQHPRIRRF